MSESTPAELFFDRALREASRYGDDPWVFLRELVQNSRDAAATRIVFTVQGDHDTVRLTCRDNGSGMSAAEMDNYLLRLYASSKEGDQPAIGCFGVGFWSVLLFRPTLIRVISRRGTQGCGFEIDLTTRRLRSVDTVPDEPGTEVTLIRATGNGDEDDAPLRARVREGLLDWAAHVGSAGGGRPPELILDGERLNRDFPLPEVLGRRFRTRRFDGTLGFGSQPRVCLYQGGLRVREVSALEEVIPSRRSRLPHSGWGLYPVVHINVDDFDLLMDRHTIAEDPVLYRAVRYCERTLLAQHRRLLRGLYPLTGRRWLRSGLDRLGRMSRSARWATVLSAVALVVLLATAWRLSAGQPGVLAGVPAGTGGGGIMAPTIQSLDGVFDSPPFPGDNPSAASAAWAFTFRGVDTSLFRLRTFNRYDPVHGLVPESLRPVAPYPAVPGPARLEVRLGVTGGGGWFVLPLPPDYGLTTNGVRDGSGRVVPAMADRFGEPMIHPEGPGEIVYTAVPHPDAARPTVIDPGPAPVWPAEARQILDRVAGLDTTARVTALADWVRSRLHYARDTGAGARPAPGGLSWSEQVLAAGQGDCDVINGIMVLLLRSAGVAAQLSVGLVGEGGRARSTLHAWVRYYDGGWHRLDLTTGAPVVPGGTSIPATAATGRATTGDSTAPPPAIRTVIAVGRQVLTWGWPVGVILLLGFWLWRRWSVPRIDRPEFLAELFEHSLRFGAGEDPFQLRHRPVFPLLGGRRASLAELETRAVREGLFGSAPDARLLPRLRHRRWVLDRRAPELERLLPFLPPVTWLEELECLLQPVPLSPLLADIDATIRKYDAAFRLHLVPGTDGFREVRLPFRKRTQGRRYVLLGEEHPLVREMESLAGADPELARFVGVSGILRRVTYYGPDGDALLARLAVMPGGTDGGGGV